MNRIHVRGALLALLVTCCVAPAAAQDTSTDGRNVAIVNGRAVTRQELLSALVESHGLELLQQLILLETAKSETDRLRLRVTAADVDREFEDALDEIARNATLTGEQNTRENRLKALQVVLEQRKVSMAEYMIAMERNAHLRAVVRQSIKLDEPTLREEFARTYGERVEVRHIQLGDPRRLNDALGQLSRGADFGEVARQLSENPESAARGGLLEPFAFDDERLPPAMREAAFALSAGETSAPVLAGRNYHILKLERRIPPQNVRFEDVREQVETNMRARVEREEMSRLMERLFREAKIRVLDPPLRTRYDEFLKRSQSPQP